MAHYLVEMVAVGVSDKNLAEVFAGDEFHYAFNSRAVEFVEHIVEEIADVQIMLDQLKMIFDCKDEVMDWMTLKLLRLENRIEEYDGPPAGEAEGLRNWSPFKEEEHEKE